MLEEETREREAGDRRPGNREKQADFDIAQVDSGEDSLAAKFDRWSVTHSELAAKDFSLPAVPGLQLLQEASHQVQVATHAATRRRGLCTPRSHPAREFRQCGAEPLSQKPMKAGSGWQATPLGQLH